MDKPPYIIPSMSEISRIRTSKPTCVSTFSGCGGSSLGYRMAGFKVLWASEFIDAARECYIANAAPYTVVDGRDIREVSASDILSAIDMKPGQLDLLDGSPPCASFSVAGKRERGWGEVRNYSDKSQRTDDLFFEFIRLLKEIQPKTFIAENVSGLVTGTAKGYFLRIMSALDAAGYSVSCRLLDAQWLGVPQSRRRTIFVGVRKDLGILPPHPKPLPYYYTIGEALEGVRKPDGIEEARFIPEGSRTMRLWRNTKPGDDFANANERLYGNYAYFTWIKAHPNKVAQTIIASSYTYHWSEPRRLTIPELRRICGFPDDFKLLGSFSKRWERLGRAVPPVMMKHIAKTVMDEVLLKSKKTNP